MIDKDAFRRIEGRLYKYYRQLKEIDKLEYMCEILEQQKERIRQDLRETNVTIEAETRSIDYSQDKIQSSSSGISYAETALIREITKLEEEWKHIRRKILKNHAKIRELKKQNADMDYIIGLLSTECKLVAEEKYKHEKSLEEIGEKLHMSKSAANRKREDIVNAIAKMLSL